MIRASGIGYQANSQSFLSCNKKQVRQESASTDRTQHVGFSGKPARKIKPAATLKSAIIELLGLSKPANIVAKETPAVKEVPLPLLRKPIPNNIFNDKTPVSEVLPVYQSVDLIPLKRSRIDYDPSVDVTVLPSSKTPAVGTGQPKVSGEAEKPKSGVVPRGNLRAKLRGTGS